jgi:hypothetical protein
MVAPGGAAQSFIKDDAAPTPPPPYFRSSQRYNALWFTPANASYADGYPVSQVLALAGGLATGGNASMVFQTLVEVGASRVPRRCGCGLAVVAYRLFGSP